MNPLETRLQELENRLSKLEYSDRYTFQKHIQLLDGKNILLASGTGTQLGTETTQKLGLYGTTPTAQQSAISSPSGGTTVDTQARTAINTIITVLKTLGITA